MITHPTMMGALRDLVDNGVFNLAGTGTPTNGTSGTGAGFAGPGSFYFDYTNGIAYVNRGTKLSPTWASHSGVGHARAVYDFAVDGGAVSTITPVINMKIPSKAIILGGIIDIITTLTSGGSATIAVGTSAGSSTTSLKAALAVASWTAGLLAIVPVFTAATMVKLTAEGQITVTVATAALTAGKFGVQVQYLLGE